MWFLMLRVMFPLRCVEGLQPWQCWRLPPPWRWPPFCSGCSDSQHDEASAAAVPGQPSVEIVSPRNGARQTSHAVVVKANIENFRLAPRQFGREPQLGEGHIRFSLNRVPDCVDPKKLLDAINSPLGNGRLVGASFDYPRYSGPNGILAERIGSAGSYSPATRPEIFYHGLPPGFYRLILNLAQQQRRDHPLPRRHQLPDPPPPRPRPQTARGQSPKRQGRRVRLRACFVAALVGAGGCASAGIDAARADGARDEMRCAGYASRGNRIAFPPLRRHSRRGAPAIPLEAHQELRIHRARSVPWLEAFLASKRLPCSREFLPHREHCRPEAFRAAEATTSFPKLIGPILSSSRLSLAALQAYAPTART